jgi:hypothetical protein
MRFTEVDPKITPSSLHAVDDRAASDRSSERAITGLCPQTAERSGRRRGVTRNGTKFFAEAFDTTQIYQFRRLGSLRLSSLEGFFHDHASSRSIDEIGVQRNLRVEQFRNRAVRLRDVCKLNELR